MAILKHTDWPELQKYWDVEYGMGVPFSLCDGIKVRSDGHYVVVRWKEGDDVEMADLTYVNGKWDMVNDGFDPITEKDWNKLRIVPDCDWFVIPGNDSFKGLS